MTLADASSVGATVDHLHNLAGDGRRSITA